MTEHVQDVCIVLSQEIWAVIQGMMANSVGKSGSLERKMRPKEFGKSLSTKTKTL